MKNVIYVENSKNHKLSDSGSERIDSTYVPIANTCSNTCPLKKDNMCYAKTSYVGMSNKKLENESKGITAIDIAKAESQAIDNSHQGKQIPFGRILRLHVSGDSRTVAGTRLLSKAVSRWLARGGKAVYSYTHSWRRVPRSVWGKVSILASVESASQVSQVRKQGYAPAMVVPQFANDKSFEVNGCDTVFIPCPQQTRGITCARCKLCLKADWLFETNRGIAFSAHGVSKQRLKKHLTIINQI